MNNVPATERMEWRSRVTPGLARQQPRHRWFVFPHSFTPELVHALADEWGMTACDHILDPFVGAGTTVLAALELGIQAFGCDLSPLAVTVTQAKIAHHSVARLTDLLESLRGAVPARRVHRRHSGFPDIVTDAIPQRWLASLAAIQDATRATPMHVHERAFFELALLSILPTYSRVVANGGWLRRVEVVDPRVAPWDAFAEQATSMLADVQCGRMGVRAQTQTGQVVLADARALPVRDGVFTGVITSPPYPNRHDYTRVFGVELAFGFLGSEGVRALRYQTIHSHPEAHPVRPSLNDYTEPLGLVGSVGRVQEQSSDARVPRMLRGYFQDMFCCLREVRRVCRPGARIAFVMGNAQYCGIPIMVDEFLADIGRQVGLVPQEIRVVRYRGNSAQQMSEYGRNPSRESIVIFTRP